MGYLKESLAEGSFAEKWTGNRETSGPVHDPRLVTEERCTPHTRHKGAKWNPEEQILETAALRGVVFLATPQGGSWGNPSPIFCQAPHCLNPTGSQRAQEPK